MLNVKLTYWPTTKVHLNTINTGENPHSFPSTLGTEKTQVDTYKQVTTATIQKNIFFWSTFHKTVFTSSIK